KREADGDTTVYGDLMKRLKVVQLASQLRMANVRVVDPAETPQARVSPNHLRDLLLALVGGLVGGVALAFVRELSDETLRTSREVDVLVRLPSIGTVPSLPRDRRRTLPPVSEPPAFTGPPELAPWPERTAAEAFPSS